MSGCSSPGRAHCHHNSWVGIPRHITTLISIRDTGPGIPSHRLERLFEPFFTKKQDGMGMGLCIAHAILEAHGGDNLRRKPSKRRGVSRQLPLARAIARMTCVSAPLSPSLTAVPPSKFRPARLLRYGAFLGPMLGVKRSRVTAALQTLQGPGDQPAASITGADNDATGKAALEAGCVAHLEKPFPSGALIEAMDKLS